MDIKKLSDAIKKLVKDQFKIVLVYESRYGYLVNIDNGDMFAPLFIVSKDYSSIELFSPIDDLDKYDRMTSGQPIYPPKR